MAVARNDLPRLAGDRSCLGVRKRGTLSLTFEFCYAYPRSKLMVAGLGPEGLEHSAPGRRVVAPGLCGHRIRLPAINFQITGSHPRCLAAAAVRLRLSRRPRTHIGGTCQSSRRPRPGRTRADVLSIPHARKPSDYDASARLRRAAPPRDRDLHQRAGAITSWRITPPAPPNRHRLSNTARYKTSPKPDQGRVLPTRTGNPPASPTPVAPLPRITGRTAGTHQACSRRPRTRRTGD